MSVSFLSRPALQRAVLQRAALQRVVLVLGLAVLGACASAPPEPVVDYAPDYDFSQVKKIGVYALSGQTTGDNPMGLTDFQKQRVNKALARAVETKGFDMVNSTADADLLVSWHLNTVEKQDVRTTSSPSMGMSMGYSRYNRYAMYNCYDCFNTTETRVTDYTQGTFIVDFIDPKMNKSVWRSVIQSKIKDDEAIQDQAKLDAGAMRIIAAFPPGQPVPAAP